MLTLEDRRRGGKARAEAFDADHQRAAQAARSKESLRAAGRKGYAATLARHPESMAKVWEKMRQHRLAHPSGPERQMMDRLSEWFGMEWPSDYEREFLPFVASDFFTVDFAWESRRSIIEVDGEVHRLPGERGEKQRYRDAARLARLEAAGWRVLVLRDTEIDTARERVVALLGPEV